MEKDIEFEGGLKMHFEKNCIQCGLKIIFTIKDTKKLSNFEIKQRKERVKEIKELLNKKEKVERLFKTQELFYYRGMSRTYLADSLIAYNRSLKSKLIKCKICNTEQII